MGHSIDPAFAPSAAELLQHAEELEANLWRYPEAVQAQQRKYITELKRKAEAAQRLTYS
jgi:hypothetical protein